MLNLGLPVCKKNFGQSNLVMLDSRLVDIALLDYDITI